MSHNPSNEWDGGEAPLYPEWDDSEYDPTNLPDWSVEDEEKRKEQIATHEAFVKSLDERLSEDIGFASKAGSIDLLVQMYLSDRPNYARAEQTLRAHKILALVRKAVNQRAREMSNITPVPGGGESLNLVRVKSQYPDAPVHDDAVVPALWILDGRKDGPKRHRIVRKIIRQREDTYYTQYSGVAYAPVVISAVMVHIVTGETNLRLSWRVKGKWYHRVIDRQKMLHARDMVVELAGAHGFPANTNNAKELIEYLTDYEAFNEANLTVLPMTGQMGWQGREGRLGFLVGRQHIKACDDEPEVSYVAPDSGESHLAQCFRAEGSKDGWCNAVSMTQDYPMVELAIYASLAPPLLRILKAPNFVIDWAGKSGTGKTTSMMVATSCWGNPDERSKDTPMCSWDMTNVGFERRATALSGLPLIVDDSKRARTARGQSIIPSVVYAISNGQGRSRGSIKGMQTTGYWRTIMITCGEDRLIDSDKSGGTPARVISLWGKAFRGTHTQEANLVRELKISLRKHYGHAGPAFVQWLIDNQDMWGELNDEYLERWTEFRERMQQESKDTILDVSIMDRVAANLAVLDVAAQVAHEALPLPWALQDVIGALLPVIMPSVSAVDREKEALRMAVSWAVQNRAKFCTNEKHRKESEPHGGWYGFWEAENDYAWDKLCFFPLALRDFLRNRGFEPKSILRQWKEAGWLYTTKNDGPRLTVKINEIEGRPRMIVLSRKIVEGPGDLGSGTSGDPKGQEEVPF